MDLNCESPAFNQYGSIPVLIALVCPLAPLRKRNEKEMKIRKER
jgi:hypothetical protein